MFLKTSITCVMFAYLYFSYTHAACSIADGNKTMPMLKLLKDGILESFNWKNQTLTHNDLEFYVLKGSNDNISLSPLVSIGENPLSREIISLDPKNSPLLESKFQDLIFLLMTHPIPYSVEPDFLRNRFDLISEFIRTVIFNPDFCNKSSIDTFVERWCRLKEKDSTEQNFTDCKFGYKIPVIPIDDFIQARVGVCRHISLVTAYFLDKILKNSSLKKILADGKVYYVRDDLSRGGHAWNLFVPDALPQVWHIDAFWGVIKDLSNCFERKDLYFEYGIPCIKAEIERFLLNR